MSDVSEKAGGPDPDDARREPNGGGGVVGEVGHGWMCPQSIDVTVSIDLA